MTKFYNHTTFPVPNSVGSSAAMKAELDAIEAAFDQVELLKADRTDITDFQTAIANAQTAVNAALAAVAAVQQELVDLSSSSGDTGGTLQLHLLDTLDAHDASAISFIAPQGFNSTNVQSAINELISTKADSTVLSSHLNAFNAHTAASISFAGTGGVSSTNVQAAIAELDAEKASFAQLNSVSQSVSTLSSSLAATNSTINTLSSSVNSKASIADVNSLATQISSRAFQSDLNALISVVNNKANQTDLTTLTNTVSTKANQTALTALTNTVNGKANAGVNGDITNLTGLTTLQAWASVRGIEFGSNVPNNGGANYLAVYNSSAVANSVARVHAICRRNDNAGWVDTYLETYGNGDYTISANGGVSSLNTSNQFLNVFSNNSTGFRWNNGVPELMPSTSIGGLIRYFSQGFAGRFDSYLTGGTTPAYRINNSNGAGVELLWNATTFQGLSDERFKIFDRDIEVDLSDLNTYKLKIGRFKHDDEGVERVFFSAQDWQAKHPQIVNENSDGQLVMSYGDTAPVLMAYMQKMLAEIQSLKAEIEQLKNNQQ